MWCPVILEGTQAANDKSWQSEHGGMADNVIGNKVLGFLEKAVSFRQLIFFPVRLFWCLGDRYFIEPTQIFTVKFKYTGNRGVVDKIRGHRRKDLNNYNCQISVNTLSMPV